MTLRDRVGQSKSAAQPGGAPARTVVDDFSPTGAEVTRAAVPEAAAAVDVPAEELAGAVPDAVGTEVGHPVALAIAGLASTSSLGRVGLPTRGGAAR